MLFDAQLQVMAVEAVSTAEGHVQLVLVPAISLPGGTGNTIPIPLGLARIGISQEAAQQLSEDLAKAAAGEDKEEEKKPSDLVVASSMAGVEEAAALNSQFKGQK